MILKLPFLGTVIIMFLWVYAIEAFRNDPYQILGLPRSRTITKQDVARAYRKQSVRYHPDRNSSPDAAIMFNRLTDAKNTLLKLVTYNYSSSGTFSAFGWQWIHNPINTVIAVAVTAVILSQIPKLFAFHFSYSIFADTVSSFLSRKLFFTI